ncbi:hypothetical protein T229_13225 [Tannerella sp. oral taxon BU063 isolate Cell 5]|uniref:Uncharacterized protein n=1 Tax=Tannerella sp. oral taxon BU063 isolate Cell 5 TaxID=1410950 RepID=W2CB46_9BACT|nr:hypothetical protein T229_13225 [Tannerella sp. oral taxon BU063 isolate Cell 5]
MTYSVPFGALTAKIKGPFPLLKASPLLGSSFSQEGVRAMSAPPKIRLIASHTADLINGLVKFILCSVYESF